MIIHIQKLYEGHCSIRSTIIEGCIKKNESVCIVYQDDYMILSPNDLKDKRTQLSRRVFRSTYDKNKYYQLFDYEWRPNGLLSQIV